MITIPLTRGFETTIDDSDTDLRTLNWYCLPNHYREPTVFYAARAESKKTILLHKVIMSRILNRPLSQNEKVDHVDGNGLNNRRSNLRLATAVQNQRNRRKQKNNKSGYKGVSLSGNKWAAQIKSSDGVIHLGTFLTPELAYEAYCEAARKYHGEFARLE
jgi:HNH endonuclease